MAVRAEASVPIKQRGGLALGKPPAIPAGQIVLLPMAYALGLVPAPIAAAFDELLARRGTPAHILWTALFGYAAAYLILLTAWLDGSVRRAYLLAFGLVGRGAGRDLFVVVRRPRGTGSALTSSCLRCEMRNVTLAPDPPRK